LVFSPKRSAPDTAAFLTALFSVSGNAGRPSRRKKPSHCLAKVVKGLLRACLGKVTEANTGRKCSHDERLGGKQQGTGPGTAPADEAGRREKENLKQRVEWRDHGWK